MDEEAAYRALAARDPRFDGRVWFGVTSTGIYCRPVCPAQTPLRRNVRFFADPAAAVSAGYRACRRCRPDSAPGSRHWDHRGDLVGRALRLIAAGAVDDGGVAGLAARLHVSERHLHRALVGSVGASPLTLARSRRAQTARLLIDQTPLPLTDVAYAAGFASVRSFNDVMRAEFGMAPSELRGRQTPALPAADPSVVLRLRHRVPYDAAAVGAHLAARVVPGLERHETSGASWRHTRVLALPSGPTIVSVEPGPDHLALRVPAARIADTAALVAGVRRWLDLDADPAAIADVLTADDLLAPLVATRPGLRVPTTVDPWETVLRAVLGQQVSLAAGITLLARLVAAYGSSPSCMITESAAMIMHELPGDPPGWAAAPTPETLAQVDPGGLAGLGMPASRARTLHAVAVAIAGGDVDLGDDPAQVRQTLLALPGVGPWTAEYVALRGLADPDAFPATDLVLRKAAQALGETRLAERAERWRPWRAYAAQHLWTHHAESSVVGHDSARVPDDRAPGVRGSPGRSSPPSSRSASRPERGSRRG